jgi:hypothetical protein
MPEESIISREANHGEKMIEVRLRFWTDDIALGSGKVRPKHAWTSGVVRMQPNKAHEIASGDSMPFNSLLDIGAVVG